MRKYYSMEVKETETELYIFGDITSYPQKEKEKDAYGIVKELQKLKTETVNVHINSYGGDVAEGLAIYNTLKNSHCKVTTYCDGFACSAASVIFMAGEERVMNQASLLLIHNAWTMAAGNANVLRKQAADLEKITQASVKAYMSNVKITEEELKQKMDDESWLTAEEALEYGFATKIIEEEVKGVNQSAFGAIREKLLHRNETNVPLQTSIILQADEIVSGIIKELKPLLKKEEQEEPEDSTGWGAFFMRKGE